MKLFTELVSGLNDVARPKLLKLRATSSLQKSVNLKANIKQALVDFEEENA